MTTKFTNGAGTVPDMASRRVVASFATYTESERAVDLLADNKFTSTAGTAHDGRARRRPERSSSQQRTMTSAPRGA